MGLHGNDVGGYQHYMNVACRVSLMSGVERQRESLSKRGEEGETKGEARVQEARCVAEMRREYNGRTIDAN